MSPLVLIAAGVGLLLLGGILWLSWPYFVSRASGVSIPWTTVIGMRIRGTDPSQIVTALVALDRLGETVSLAEIEAAFMSLPHGQRDWSALVRRVRPALISRLEQRLKPTS